MTIEIEDKSLTLQQAATYLESPDRALRQAAYERIQERKLQDKEALHVLYTTLVKKRHQLAVNAGFQNFRDYAFVALNRFDYTPADCKQFHSAIKEEIVPLLNELAVDHKKCLGLNVLQPFDHAVDPQGNSPLRPFTNVKELLDKTILVLQRMDPFLADCLHNMHNKGHLDLESRKNKAPGGYNYPLNETGIPFIFMNATCTLQDVTTMLHESGHVIHFFLMRDLALHAFKECPSEIAELASMSMELLTMPHWDIFFPNPQELKRAQEIISCIL